MNLFDKFAAGLPLPQFLAKYGSDADRAKWARAADQLSTLYVQVRGVRRAHRENDRETTGAVA